MDRDSIFYSMVLRCVDFLLHLSVLALLDAFFVLFSCHMFHQPHDHIYDVIMSCQFKRNFNYPIG